MLHPAPKSTLLPNSVPSVRAFNRFYTRQIGVLREGLLGSSFSLTETRVLYELAHRRQPSAVDLSRDLDLDPGYLSRILLRFRRERLLSTGTSQSDRRFKVLALTEKGTKVFSELNARSDKEVSGWLARLTRPEQRRLVGAMRAIQSLLDSGPRQGPAIVFRPHEPGDMGWVVESHGALYAREYAYDSHFESLVARIVADFLDQLDARRERCWISELDGERVGSVFLVKETNRTAKLRLLLVDPKARGLGIGKRLVEESVRFAKNRGYRKVTLWTQSHLEAARSLYQSLGFKLRGRKRHQTFGLPLTAETWELDLARGNAPT
jgi:DNA-binding MarR family transcriptional regulator/GNAT superfamily N-acetyltransferase